jgi:hypothetical protein
VRRKCRGYLNRACMSALPALLCVRQNSERVGRFRNGSSDPGLAPKVTCKGPRTAFSAYLMGAKFGRAPPQTEGTERQARDLRTDSRTTFAKLPAATARSRRELKTGRAPSNHLSLTHFTLRPRFTFLSLSSPSRPTHIHTSTTLSALIYPSHSSFYPSIPPIHLPFSTNFTYLAVAVNVTVPVASLVCSNRKQLSCITLTFLPSLIN